MVIFDLAPLSHWRQKRHAAQVAVAQNLAYDAVRLMLIIELQRLQLQRAQQQRDELLTLLRQRIDDAKSRNTAAKAGGTRRTVM